MCAQENKSRQLKSQLTPKLSPADDAGRNAGRSADPARTPVTDHRFASRVSRLQGSALRKIFSVIKTPGMISFAGGLPAATRFPKLNFDVVDTASLQYGPSEGDLKLREQIALQLQHSGLDVSAEQVLVLSGSQQGIDLVAKLFVDEATRVGLESPTYLAAMQVMTLLGAEYCPFTPGNVEELAAHDAVDLLYLNPTFQNPTGGAYSTEQRASFAQHCQRHNIVLFEDDPYRDLYYEPCERRPVCSFLAENSSRSSWIYQSSFSKSLAPGLRLGFLTCSEDLYEPLLFLKQAADLHTSGVSQALVSAQLGTEAYQNHLTETVGVYRQMRDDFEHALGMTLAPYFDWSRPSGGLFFWLTLKSSIELDIVELFEAAVQQGVAFMPGEYFRVPVNPAAGLPIPGLDRSATAQHAASHTPQDTQSLRSMRLNFTCATQAEVQSGLGILADLVRQRAHSAVANGSS